MSTAGVDSGAAGSYSSGGARADSGAAGSCRGEATRFGGMVRHCAGVGGPEWLTFPAFDELEWLIHGFTLRIGGVSAPPYTSLNMGLHVGDDEVSVIENRRRACSCLGIDSCRLVWGRQVHGLEVAIADDRAAGSCVGEDSGADAVVTKVAGLPLASFYADCVPIFLVCPTTCAVGLVHAGWRGAVGRIAQRAVRVMSHTFHSPPERLLAGIGPHIGPCCFSVGSDILEAYEVEFGSCVIRRSIDGTTVSLEAAVISQLLEAGINRENISTSELCTSCNTDVFFSHRAEGKCSGATGRMASLMSVKPGEDDEFRG